MRDVEPVRVLCEELRASRSVHEVGDLESKGLDFSVRVRWYMILGLWRMQGALKSDSRIHDIHFQDVSSHAHQS